ncbi:hypothetical protein EXIGLDRAFT_841547 [Exidia glandulosa HHB12029]|uniref:DUF6534 domain-containing protein n=1 Tax=Exidia glandulosa HHB12029 TaxID=1314781 RepID=A0A165ZRZ9_EXIGL|nr:hypothetical protein EXIGLDRAFT_841547 [Exidia glandulosa HHB12029]
MSTSSADMAAFLQYAKDHPGRTLGRWLLGCIADCLLTGIIVAMGIKYWTQYSRKDGIRLKALVLITIILSFLRMVQTTAVVWFKLIDNFGDYAAVSERTPWYGLLDPLTSELLVLFAQLFFGVRLFILVGRIRRKHAVVFIPLALALVTGLVSEIIVTVQLFHMQGSIRALHTYRRVMWVMMAGVLFSNLWMTAWSLHYLRKAGAGIAYKSTDSCWRRIMHLIFLSALPPCVIEILRFILLHTLIDTDSIWILFHFMSSKSYVICMLYTINARKDVEEPEFAPRICENSKPMSMGINFFHAPHTTADSITDAVEDRRRIPHSELEVAEIDDDDNSTTFEFVPWDGAASLGHIPRAEEDIGELTPEKELSGHRLGI